MRKLWISALLCAAALWAEAPITGVVVTSSPFQPGRYRAPVPRYSGGRIMAINPDLTSFTLWAANGDPGPAVNLASADFGAAGLKILALAAGVDGRLAASVSFTNAAGASASALVWMHPDGRVERVVRTSPFAARAIEFDQAGQLWAAGRVHNATFQEEPDFPVLRRYDAAGKLTLTALPKSSFVSLENSSLGELRLAVSGDHAGLLSIDGREYVEVAPDGSVTNRRPVRIPQHSMVTGFSMTAGGGVWLSLQHNHAVASVKPGIGDITGVYKLADSGELTPVDTQNLRTGRQGIKLMGASRSDLILRTTPPGDVVVLRVAQRD